MASHIPMRGYSSHPLPSLQNYDDSLLMKPTILARNISHWDCTEVLDLAGNLVEGGGYYLQLADANLATVRPLCIRLRGRASIVRRSCRPGLRRIRTFRDQIQGRRLPLNMYKLNLHRGPATHAHLLAHLRMFDCDVHPRPARFDANPSTIRQRRGCTSRRPHRARARREEVADVGHGGLAGVLLARGIDVLGWGYTTFVCSFLHSSLKSCSAFWSVRAKGQCRSCR